MLEPVYSVVPVTCLQGGPDVDGQVSETGVGVSAINWKPPTLRETDVEGPLGL